MARNASSFQVDFHFIVDLSCDRLGVYDRLLWRGARPPQSQLFLLGRQHFSMGVCDRLVYWISLHVMQPDKTV